MAIDAIIAWTHARPDGSLELDLVARNSQAGPAGQPRLILEPPYTWRPVPGLAIWGGDGWVEIVTDPPRRYRRIGYGRLREEKE